DGSGAVITSLSAIKSLTVTIGSTTYTLYDGTTSFYSGNTVLRNDGSQYIFNWLTKSPFTAGTYTLTLTLSDNSTHTTTIVLSTSGATMNLMAGSAGITNISSAGGLLAGDMMLYVDNSSGYFTPDELARLEDAIASINKLVSPYGTTITEVFDSAFANIIVDISTTSASGGFADGVLGCETAAGEITLIQGWNWSTGADTASIGADQYDFQTIVTHEIGHALGLGHSADATSVMYASLGSGEIRRTMTTADLNVADSDGGACALHAFLPGLDGTSFSAHSRPVIEVAGNPRQSLPNLGLGSSSVLAGLPLANPNQAPGALPAQLVI